ncbi:hypothetical protein crov534 [Cafeteria roenbergensis virus]|uniref:Uncharacterized protein n=1 Tax=Cafeteria roenbergensis virus (strain BV-PW1) TaxID=693272 RepID=E3T5V5_CROVB|nr:hypothetical protein crov534 [Cafeteria roenbergensis virus BV-PW1]ADO67568.1 hypothetical protein crov534 [Cafeteria roenbergensis virus BV-PW1]
MYCYYTFVFYNYMTLVIKNKRKFIKINNIYTLTFGEYFNQLLDFLQESLKELTLYSATYKHDLSNLPSSLNSIKIKTFGKSYDHI